MRNNGNTVATFTRRSFSEIMPVLICAKVTVASSRQSMPNSNY